jgi:hypothetical protein
MEARVHRLEAAVRALAKTAEGLHVSVYDGVGGPGWEWRAKMNAIIASLDATTPLDMGAVDEPGTEL